MKNAVIHDAIEFELALREGKQDHIKLRRGIRRFTFSEKDRETILHYSDDLFIDEDSIEEKISIFFDLLIQYKGQGNTTLLINISQHTTSKKRDKEKNMLKGIEYILDYLGGEIVYKNEKERDLKRLLKELRQNPKIFRNKIMYYKKVDLKSDLRKIFIGKTDEINNFVNAL